MIPTARFSASAIVAGAADRNQSANNMETLINHLRNHQANAAGCFSTLTGQRSDFVEGYLMAINHAIELAQVIEARRQQEGK